MVPDGALKLGRVLYGNDPVMGRDLRHHVKNGINERSLTGTGGAHGQNILFARNGGADNLGVAQAANVVDETIPLPKMIQRIVLESKNSGLFILRKGKDLLRAQPNCEYRTPHNGRNNTFKTAAIERKFRFNNWVRVVHDRALPRRNRVEGTCRLGRRHHANLLKTLAHLLYPERGIWIQYDVFGPILREQVEYGFAQFALQFRFQPRVLFVMAHSRNSPKIFLAFRGSFLHFLCSTL